MHCSLFNVRVSTSCTLERADIAFCTTPTMPAKMVAMIFWKQLGAELRPKRHEGVAKTPMWVTKVVT